jgi:hypothetical protein
MPGDNFQDQEPVYSFQGSSPADELLEIARIHRREAKQLFDNAHAAQAEGREEEARLLMDLAVARRERADEFERAARGEGSDPVVTEILDWQEDLCADYVPPTSNYTPADGELPEGWLEEYSPPKRGRIARAVAWVGSFMP